MVSNGANDTVDVGAGANAITIGAGSADVVQTQAWNGNVFVTAAAVSITATGGTISMSVTLFRITAPQNYQFVDFWRQQHNPHLR